MHFFFLVFTWKKSRICGSTVGTLCPTPSHLTLEWNLGEECTDVHLHSTARKPENQDSHVLHVQPRLCVLKKVLFYFCF